MFLHGACWEKLKASSKLGRPKVINIYDQNHWLDFNSESPRALVALPWRALVSVWVWQVHVAISYSQKVRCLHEHQQVQKHQKDPRWSDQETRHHSSEFIAAILNS